jgi:Ca2+-binding EF-hand superfamily protein
MTISSNSLYGASSGATYGYGTKHTASSTSSFAEELLTSMDSDGSGSIDSTEFSSAALALLNNDESALSDAFSSLDSDSDGAISADELNSLFSQQASTMAAGSMPPPPPPPSSTSSEEDTGLTLDEMTSMLKDVSSTDSNLATLLTSVSENFDEADADGDGKVTFAEAMSYQQSTQENSTDSTEESTLAAAGSMPPPPPPPPSSSAEGDDKGYSADELTAMAENVSSTDSNLSSLFETLAANFDEADTNGDGKVSAAEAQAYQDATTQSNATSDTTSSNSEESGDMMKALLAQIISNYASQNSLSQSSVSFSA